jgi:hypothetical protein
MELLTLRAADYHDSPELILLGVTNKKKNHLQKCTQQMQKNIPFVAFKA